LWSPQFTASGRRRARPSTGAWRTPPLFAKSPFHGFGVRLNKKADTVRDRRLSRDKEKRLLDTALQQMNTERSSTSESCCTTVIGALELVCRCGEMLLIQNKRVNWDTCQTGILGATAKHKENRHIPFNPHERVAAILKSRALGLGWAKARLRRFSSPVASSEE
jgi:hypothetical protein